MTDAQLSAARASVNMTTTFPDALRHLRSPREGLLLLYPISPNSLPRSGSQSRLPLFDDADRNGVTVVGLAMVFPASASAATIEYVVGSVGALQGDAQ